MRRLTLLLSLCLILCGCADVEATLPTTEATIPPTVTATEATDPSEPASVPDCTEIVAQEFSDDAMVPVLDYLPELLVELKYATSDNFTGEVVYDAWEVFLRYGTVQKLMAAEAEFQEMGLRLKLWDAFRPVSAQAKLWAFYPDKNYVSHPETGYRNHCRGNAVDVTLCDAEGRELEMPSRFDDFSAQADWDFSDCTETAAENAQLLRQVMENNGLMAYNSEWWHFTDEAAYPVEETFEPADRILCYAICEEFITLRKEPSTAAEAITRIPAGGAFTVLAYDGDFALVEYDGCLQGYVLQEYIGPTPSETEPEEVVEEDVLLNRPWYYANCEEYINLREQADITAAVITQIPVGEKFQLLEAHGKFALVDYQGIIGYVVLEYIEPVQ